MQTSLHLYFYASVFICHCLNYGIDKDYTPANEVEAKEYALFKAVTKLMVKTFAILLVIRLLVVSVQRGIQHFYGAFSCSEDGTYWVAESNLAKSCFLLIKLNVMLTVSQARVVLHKGVSKTGLFGEKEKRKCCACAQKKQAKKEDTTSSPIKTTSESAPPSEQKLKVEEVKKDLEADTEMF